MKKKIHHVALAIAASVVAFMAAPAFADVIGSMLQGGGELTTTIAFGGVLVNKESIQSAFVSIKTIFNNALGNAQTNWQKIAMKVPSSTGREDYAWLSKFPKMREWIGDKVVKSLAAQSYSIKNKDFEATVAVDRNDIEDDALGIYAPQAQMAGESAAQLPDEIVFALVNGAFANKGPDGQFFIDTDHPVGDGAGGVVSVSNKGTKKLSAATSAAAEASLGVARVAMRKFKDDEGRPLNITPNVLLVGPALETTANKLSANELLANGDANPFKGTFTVVCDARITSDDAWFLLDTTKAVKPFIYQERKAPVFVQQTDPQADDVFTRKEFKFGAEARAAGGYGFWQLAYGSDGSVS